MKKLLIESSDYTVELESNAEEGDVLEIFKIGEKIKNTLQKLKSLEYLKDITPNTLFYQYRPVFEKSGETMLPDDLDPKMKDLFN